MASSSSEIVTALVLWTLGLMPASDLPRVAVEALQDGRDSQALRSLAGADGEEGAVVTHLFQQVVGEAGILMLSKRDAACLYAEAICRKIVGGHLPPLEGARFIIVAARRVSDSSFHDLDPFIYAESEAESRPEEKEFFDLEIRAEAERWVQKGSERSSEVTLCI